jgi:RNase adaptor protein for sRNA GlmZ degradation
MIFTFAYAGKPDDHFVSQVVQQVERYGGQVDFVQLTASENDLRQRVTHQQRVHMGKIHTVRDLNGFLTDRDIRATVPFSNNFVVNTSEHSLQTAAELIIHQYQLKPA